MAHLSKHLPNGNRITDELAMGILAKTYPTAQVREILQQQGRASQRERELPAHLMVYYVMGLGLWMGASCREVLRCLLMGVQWLLGGEKVYKVTGKSGITQARQRLGWEVMRAIYNEVVQPIGQQHTRGAWYRNWRVVSLDGSTLEIADTEGNEKAFGRPGASRGAAAYPLLRFVGLVENGSHVLFGAQLGGYKTGETRLAAEAVKWLQKDMLCLADREFLSYKLWNEARGRSALLWRGKKHLRLPCYRRLSDGSYLSFIYASAKDRRHHRNGVLVRVIEYRLKGVAKSEPFYRLVTTLLDPDSAPAQELAALYHERWEIETALDEFKIHLRGARLVLRSKTPDLVRQEFYGFLLTYFAIRGLMHEAALRVGEDTDRLSFANAVEVIRRKLYTFAISPLRRASAVA